MEFRRTINFVSTASVAFWLVATAVNPAHSFVIQLDSFNVMRNNAVFMNDDFGDTAGLGLAGPTISVFNNGGTPPLGIYSTGSAGSTAAQSDGGGVRTFNTRLDTPGPSTNPATPNNILYISNFQMITDRSNVLDPNGLKSNDTFKVEAVVSLGDFSDLLPLSSYGVRLRDGGAGKDDLRLVVGRNAAGAAVVGFRRRDNTQLPPSTLIEEIMLSAADIANHDQIMLSLAKLSPGTNTITASFELLNGGVGSGVQTVSTTTDIFDGESWTRAGFRVFESVPVNEPGTLAILGLGLVGLGLTRRRQGA